MSFRLLTHNKGLGIHTDNWASMSVLPPLVGRMSLNIAHLEEAIRAIIYVKILRDVFILPVHTIPT